MYYPAMLDLSKFKIVIIGGGKVALRKAKTIVQYHGKPTIISKSFEIDFEELVGKVKLVHKSYEVRQLEEATLVIAATDDLKSNDEIGKYCLKKGILCNIATNQALSSFIVPSSLQRGDLIIAVSTSGSSPALAKRIRNELAEQYDASYETYLNELGKRRKAIKSEVDEKDKRSKALQALAKRDKEPPYHISED